jgi:hypothetical protein
VVRSLGVGIEIDNEENTTPNLGLQAFINAYRSQLPYDATGAKPRGVFDDRRRAGDRFLIDLDPKAYDRQRGAVIVLSLVRVYSRDLYR